MAKCLRVLTAILAISALTTGDVVIAPVLADAQVEGWPQFRGPRRDGVSREHVPLVVDASAPPAIRWRVPAGDGYSGVAVHGGRLYTMDSDDADEFVRCLDEATGRELWRVRSDAKLLTPHGDGPRATPTLAGEMLFALGARSQLLALRAKDGSVVWRRDLQRDFRARTPFWGAASSPLVYQDLVIVHAGGVDASFIAFDVATGDVKWTALSDPPGYSSPILMTWTDGMQVVGLTAEAIVSLSPDTGRLLWRVPWVTDFGANAATPVSLGLNRVFVSSAYDVGAIVLELTRAGDGVSARQVWRSKVMKTLFQTAVFHRGYVYGFDNSVLKCVDAATGRERWRHRSVGRASLVLSGDRLVVVGELGVVALVAATADGYQEHGRAHVVNARIWAAPALTQGRLYVRTHHEILAVDLTRPGHASPATPAK